MKKIVILLIFVLLFLATRLPGLGADIINPDGVNWHFRSEQFIVALKSKQFSKTDQHYHPGVTLMWVTGVPVEVVKQIWPEDSVYNHLNFITFHTVAKTTLVFVQLVLSVIAIYYLSHVLYVAGYKNAHYLALAVVALFTFEPFFVGNSRILHLDILLTLFLFIGLLLSYLAITTKKTILYATLSGLFLGLAFITKSVAVGGFAFALFFGGFYIYITKGKLALSKYKVALILAFIVGISALFPAMWVDPIDTIVNIFKEAERVGGRKGHGQIVLGEYSRDPGVIFYALVYLMKVSPFTLGGIFAYKFLRFKKYKSLKNKIDKNTLINYLKRPEAYLAVFYIGYIIVMTIPSKKIDRYLLAMYPWFALVAVLGYYQLYNYLKKSVPAKKLQHFFTAVGAGAALFVAYPIYNTHPYQFTYTSPLFINSRVAHKVIAQKPFGVAIPALRDHILATYSEKYGEFPRIGFIDIKPMGAIYRNSRIFDIRINGASDYDIIVLGPNEVMPENVTKNWQKFNLAEVKAVNGLPYWYIYLKDETIQEPGQ